MLDISSQKVWGTTAEVTKPERKRGGDDNGGMEAQSGQTGFEILLAFRLYCRCHNDADAEILCSRRLKLSSSLLSTLTFHTVVVDNPASLLLQQLIKYLICYVQACDWL